MTAVLVVFFGIFIAVGTGVGYFVSYRPLSLAYQARSWTPTQCQVISSRIEYGDDSARPDIVYRYQVGGREYQSNRYNFVPGSNSDSSTPEVVERHPAGATFECYVDPADPTQAVINRTPTIWYYMGVIAFVVFAVIPGGVGFLMLRGLWRSKRQEQQAATAAARLGAAADARFASPSGAPATSGPVVLEPATTPMGKLLGAVFFCLVWNSITGVATYFEFAAWGRGEDIGCMALFLLVFQIVGLMLLVNVPYQMLALANPRPKITLGRGTVPVGGSTMFQWELSGRAQRVTYLTVTLRGREEARYRRGTDTSTDTHVFHTQKLVDTNQPMQIARGQGTLQIPADSMHTFTADNNKIIWTLQVKGEIMRWPDIDETFDITVGPA